MKRQTIVLGDNPLVNLKLFLLKDTEDNTPKPFVIVCPGGGFLGCSPNEGAPVARMLNRAGFHAAVLTYTTAATAPGVDAYPQALFDLADAIRAVRVNATEWAVDQQRIAVLGFSAGEWLCAMYETHWNTALFSDHGTPEERQPNAAVLCYPLVDYRGGGMIKRDEADMEAVLGEGAAVQMKAFQAAVDKALLGDRELTDELVREISPTNHISDGTPPTFVWTTFGDGLLDPLQSLEYARKLHTASIPCELHVFQDGAHGLSLATEATAHKPEQVDLHLAHWAELACEWLDRTFA